MLDVFIGADPVTRQPDVMLHPSAPRTTPTEHVVRLVENARTVSFVRRQVTASRTASDTVPTWDEVRREYLAPRSAVERTTVTDALTRTTAAGRFPVADARTEAAVSRTAAVLRRADVTTTTTDAVSGHVTRTRDLAERVFGVDSLARVLALGRFPTEDLVTEAVVARGRFSWGDVDLPAALDVDGYGHALDVDEVPAWLLDLDAHEHRLLVDLIAEGFLVVAAGASGVLVVDRPVVAALDGLRSAERRVGLQTDERVGLEVDHG